MTPTHTDTTLEIPLHDDHRTTASTASAASTASSSSTSSITSTSSIRPSDAREALARVCAACGQVQRNVRADQLDLPTPCDEMNVSQLVAHILMVGERIDSIARYGNAFGAGGGTERPDIPTDLFPVTDPGAAAEQWEASRASLVAGWSEIDDMNRRVVLPWRPATAQEAAELYVSEVVVHTWDLAIATGQDVEVDDADVEVGFARMRAELPATGRAEMFAATGIRAPFGEATAVPADMPLVARLAAYNGRQVA